MEQCPALRAVGNVPGHSARNARLCLGYHSPAPKRSPFCQRDCSHPRKDPFMWSGRWKRIRLRLTQHCPSASARPSCFPTTPPSAPRTTDSISFPISRHKSNRQPHRKKGGSACLIPSATWQIFSLFSEFVQAVQKNDKRFSKNYFHKILCMGLTNTTRYSILLEHPQPDKKGVLRYAFFL